MLFQAEMELINDVVDFMPDMAEVLYKTDIKVVVQQGHFLNITCQVLCVVMNFHLVFGDQSWNIGLQAGGLVIGFEAVSCLTVSIFYTVNAVDDNFLDLTENLVSVLVSIRDAVMSVLDVFVEQGSEVMFSGLQALLSSRWVVVFVQLLSGLLNDFLSRSLNGTVASEVTTGQEDVAQDIASASKNIS